MQMFGPNKCCISLQDIEFDLSDKQKKHTTGKIPFFPKPFLLGGCYKDD